MRPAALLLLLTLLLEAFSPTASRPAAAHRARHHRRPAGTRAIKATAAAGTEQEAAKGARTAAAAGALPLEQQAAEEAAPVQLEDDRPRGAALCLAFRNQAAELREWLDWHAELGFDRIIIMDNNSTESIEHVIQDHVELGVVQHVRFGTGEPEENDPQSEAYRQCLELVRGKFAWMGVWDADEFLVIPGNQTLKDILWQYRGYGGLAVNWRQFGSSGHNRRPKGGTLRNYWSCYPPEHENNRHVKSIVVPHRAVKPLGAHHWEYREPFHAVNTNFKRVPGAFSEPIDFSLLVLHHYVLKSREDFEEKMKRGPPHPHPHKEWPFFDWTDADATDKCTALLDWRPQWELQLRRSWWWFWGR